MNESIEMTLTQFTEAITFAENKNFSAFGLNQATFNRDKKYISQYFKADELKELENLVIGSDVLILFKCNSNSSFEQLKKEVMSIPQIRIIFKDDDFIKISNYGCLRFKLQELVEAN